MTDGCFADDRVVLIGEGGDARVVALDGMREIASWKALWSPGGRRVALAAGGSIVVTAAWDGGVAGYDAASRGELWVRRDLGHAQVLASVRSSPHAIVAVLREGRASCAINPRTGRELGPLVGSGGASDGDGLLITATRSRMAAYLLDDWTAVRQGPRWQVASRDHVVCVAVREGIVAVAGAGGVVARDLADGGERWRWPAADAIVRAIAATGDGWLVHQRPYSGGPATIVALGPDGALREEVGGTPGDVLALLGGDVCVRRDGARWNWRLGRVIG